MRTATTPAYYTYDNVEVAIDGIDVNWKVQGGFNNVLVSRFVSIRTDATITVKINDDGNDAITITSTDSPFELTDFLITNLFITGTANVKILNY